MIEEIQGDVFKSDADVLVHGCNCFNAMGAGIAKTVREFYPDAWMEDQKTMRGDKNKLGTFTLWTGKHYYYDQPIFVINLYSQYKYGHTEVYVDYDAIKKGMIEIADTFPCHTIAMPKIGAGLARGDWNIIKEIIEDVFDEHELVKVYYL